MQAPQTPLNDIVDRSYFTQKAIGNLEPPTRPAPSPSPSQFPAPEHEVTRSRLPRTSSLLPPPHLASSPNYSSVASPHASPSIGALPDRVDHITSSIGYAGPSQSPAKSSTTFVNRWSTSTGSSRSNSISRTAALRPSRRTSSIDTTFLLTSSPTSTKRRSRRLQKSRQPSDQSDLISDTTTNSSPAAPKADPQPYLGLPTFNPLSSLVQDYSTALDHREASQNSSHHFPQTRTDTDTIESPQRSLGAVIPDTMPYDEQGQESSEPQGHASNRSGKGSSDSAKSPSHKPSQKAMLSRALQKANTAVQLDNNQDVVGARQAYGEACELLQHVLQRTSAQEDKRKLEAIRRTYTSRIEELDQMLPWHGGESKALPAFPDSEEHHRETIYHHDYERETEAPNIEAATMNTVILDGSHSPQPPAMDSTWCHDHGDQKGKPQEHARPSLPIHPPEPGFLQSSFSRSPVRSRFPGNPLRALQESNRTYAHVSSPTQHLPFVAHHGDDLDGPVRSDFSATSDSRSDSRRGFEHVREDSQNSWLDPIDESGGSTASSVHSRTSSMGYRRRHIRSGSGDTEAEFDTALDAAIEAAYDDGYEPMETEDANQVDPDEEIVANALRRVELARQRVRQTEREAYEMANERERERFQLQPQHHYPEHQDASRNAEDFFDDNSSEEEERMLEEMTRDYAMQGFQGQKQQQKQSSVPRESDSSGFTSRTWQSSIASNPPGTGTTSLSTVTETTTIPSMPKGPPPAAPPPTQALPDIPPLPPSSAMTVRGRRMSGQNHKQLKIETTRLSPPLPVAEDLPQPKSGLLSEEDDAAPAIEEAMKTTMTHRQPVSPGAEASSAEAQRLGSPFGHRPPPDGEDNAGGRSSSPSVSKLKKNFSSSSLRSLRSRNMSVSHLDEGGDMSPGTPSSSQWGNSRTPAIPAIPTTVTANLRDKMEPSTGGMYLLDDTFHSPDSPGEPDQTFPDAPVPLEPCPTHFMLRPFWLMRCLYQTLVHPRGGYLSSKLFVPRDAWRVKGVKLKNVEDKIANCDFLTAALLKLSRVDTCDADAMLEEMQSMEGVLEQTQASLSRKLGNEVGVQSTGNLFKDASAGIDGDTSSSLPRSASVSGKSSFSWRRLRSKNSAAALSTQSRGVATDPNKDAQGLTTLPMTAQPTSKPAKRDMSQVQFTGPNAHYMGSLARLFNAAQVIDQIARQVEDPGLRHADKTQVGLELCTRHAAEFFGFYICRFVLTDLGMLMDKFIKRGSEWVLV